VLGISISLKWLIDEIKYWLNFTVCRHHTPWKKRCMLDRRGIWWKCCECGKRREMF